MKRAMFRRLSIPGWVTLLAWFVGMLYKGVDAWSNAEFLREKLQGWRIDTVLSVLSATPAQIALLIAGLTWIAVVAFRRPAEALRLAAELQPASAIGELDMHRRPKRFLEQVRDMQREVHDPYGHELRRLLDLLKTEIAGNLKYRPATPERGYLTAVFDHIRSHRAENEDPELTRALQTLSAAYSAAASYQPPRETRFFISARPTYNREAKAALLLIEARANPGAQTADRSPDLSREARELLLEAALARDGLITRFSTFGGVSVRTNQRNFAENADARSVAQWRGAVDELRDHRLIEDRAGNGEVFYLTAAGYKTADLLQKT
jgi:hypothetical protein